MKIDFAAISGINILSVPTEHFINGIYTMKLLTSVKSVEQILVVVK
jgi:hypothetical protein